jgi:hypothetical protein
MHSGGSLKAPGAIRIVGAISIDNEFTREFRKTMKEYHETKMLHHDNYLGQKFLPQIVVTPVNISTPVTVVKSGGMNIPLRLNPSADIKEPVSVKHRKTRKRRS